MTKQTLVSLLAIFFLATVFSASAQQPAKVPRIGWLTGRFLSTAPDRHGAFCQRLRELGYVEGKNIIIEWRGADNIRERGSAVAGA